MLRIEYGRESFRGYTLSVDPRVRESLELAQAAFDLERSGALNVIAAQAAVKKTVPSWEWEAPGVYGNDDTYDTEEQIDNLHVSRYLDTMLARIRQQLPLTPDNAVIQRPDHAEIPVKGIALTDWEPPYWGIASDRYHPKDFAYSKDALRSWPAYNGPAPTMLPELITVPALLPTQIDAVEKNWDSNLANSPGTMSAKPSENVHATINKLIPRAETLFDPMFSPDQSAALTRFAKALDASHRIAEHQIELAKEDTKAKARPAEERIEAGNLQDDSKATYLAALLHKDRKPARNAVR